MRTVVIAAPRKVGKPTTAFAKGSSSENRRVC